ncbi:MAG: ATP-binding protein [Polyangiaceae bacterium]
MTLRGKLLLTTLPLVLALVLTTGGALYAAFRFGSAPDAILQQNFKSFDAGRNMVHAIDTIDGLVFAAALRREPFQRETAAQAIADFDRELRTQEGNITETGEREATKALRTRWERYVADLDEASSTSRLEGYLKRSGELQAAVDTILDTNRGAMHRKSDLAREESRRIGVMLGSAALVALLLALVFTGTSLRRTLAPVRVLERAVGRLADGDFEARIRFSGSDEIASLSRSFNDMAERLLRYRQSSVGELLEANGRLESVMDSLADGVIVYDLDGTPTANNQVVVQWTGHELTLEALPEALQDAVRNAFETVKETGQAYEPRSIADAVEVPGAPTPRWLLAGATPVRARDGLLSGITVALRDVSTMRRLEGFHGDLVAAAAHELRTPLTSLHMAVHLCLEGAAGPITDRQQDLLATARSDCERLQSVVEELLELARLESGAATLALSKVNVAEALRDAVARLEPRARQLGSRLVALQGDGLLEVDADAARLARALDNLIENALVHSGGSDVEVGFESQHGTVRIFVDDAGRGIPQELRERVFSKFFRVPGTTKQGNGLGLSIVRDIVNAHGGEVGAADSPLGGARVWLTIPKAR